MNIKHSIGLNLSADAIPGRLHMVQGDANSRSIVATLWDGAQPYSIPAGAAVMVRFRKPDGTGGLYDATESGNQVSYAGSIVTAPVATQMLAVAGDVFAEIDIFGSGSGAAAERLATFRFIVEVAPCVLLDAEIISSDYYNILASDIADAKAAADLAKDYAAAAKQSADSAAVSVEGAVKYNTAQTLTDAQKQQARENIGAPAPYNPKLLDNWYWGNPVNQRGQASYTGADFTTYSIDRWLCHGSVRLSNGAIEVSREGSPYGYGYFLQKLGCSIDGKTVTASVLTSDGVLRWGTLVATSEEQTVLGTDDGLSALKVSSSSFKFSIGSTDNVYKIIAVGLELGSQQTLAHQENGVWVLNEIPKFGDQLAECQRYYIEGDAIAVYSNDGAWAVPLRIEMRTAPSVKYSNVQSYQIGTEMTVNSYFISRSTLLPGFSAERVDSGDACALVHYSASADL